MEAAIRYTLKELVDRILESMESDEVNTISDTTESLAVANIIKECYFDIVSEIEFKETEGLFHLDSSGDNLKPTVMYLPQEVSNIKWLKYNVGDSISDFNFRDLCYLCLSDFIQHTNGLDSDETWVNTQTVDIQGQDFVFKYRTDQSPYYWTSPDDRTLIFDNYDSTYETTLTSSRTYGFGGIVPVFQLVDTFVPKLDPRQFQLLLNAAKAQAFVELKQTTNNKAEAKERRNRILGYKTRDNTDPRGPLQKRKGFGR